MGERGQQHEGLRILEKGRLGFYQRAAQTRDWRLGRFILTDGMTGRRRSVTLGTNRVPDVNRDGQPVWGLVDRIWSGVSEGEEENSPSGSEAPAAEGEYALVVHETHTHLVYDLEFGGASGSSESAAGHTQGDLRLRVKNPMQERPEPEGLPDHDPALLPDDSKYVFHSQKLIDIEETELLNFERIELLLESVPDEDETVRSRLLAALNQTNGPTSKESHERGEARQGTESPSERTGPTESSGESAPRKPRESDTTPSSGRPNETLSEPPKDEQEALHLPDYSAEYRYVDEWNPRMRSPEPGYRAGTNEVGKSVSIEEVVRDALKVDPNLNIRNLDVKSFGAGIIVKGEVFTNEDMIRAQEVARACPGVDVVENELVVNK